MQSLHDVKVNLASLHELPLTVTRRGRDSKYIQGKAAQMGERSFMVSPLLNRVLRVS